MKTIKHEQTGEVKRIPEKDAKQILPTGWAYCPKSALRADKNARITRAQVLMIDAAAKEAAALPSKVFKS